MALTGLIGSESAPDKEQHIQLLLMPADSFWVHDQLDFSLTAGHCVEMLGSAGARLMDL